jgi:hypothetical protein
LDIALIPIRKVKSEKSKLHGSFYIASSLPIVPADDFVEPYALFHGSFDAVLSVSVRGFPATEVGTSPPVDIFPVCRDAPSGKSPGCGILSLELVFLFIAARGHLYPSSGSSYLPPGFGGLLLASRKAFSPPTFARRFPFGDA